MLLRYFAYGFFLLIYTSSSYAAASLSETQTLQISTNLSELVGKPTWTLIVRDIKSGLVSPYVFEIKKHENYWVAFTYGHMYRVTASSLSFGPFAKINNFCDLENGILTGISMYMTISGALTPDPKSYRCVLVKYSDPNFTIANPNYR